MWRTFPSRQCQKASAQTFAFVRARECGCAGQQTSWPADREVSVTGAGGCDHGNHKPQSLPRETQFPNVSAPGTTRRLLSTRQPRGPSGGLARAPSPLEQSLETGRNFSESESGGRAGPEARWAPAAGAPQLPERQKRPAPPGRPQPRPRVPRGERAERRKGIRPEPDSRQGHGEDGAPPDPLRSPSALPGSPRPREESYLQLTRRGQENSRGPKPTEAALSSSRPAPRRKWAARRPRPRPAPRPPPPPRGPGTARPSQHLPPTRSSWRLPPLPCFPGPRFGGEHGT